MERIATNSISRPRNRYGDVNSCIPDREITLKNWMASTQLYECATYTLRLFTSIYNNFSLQSDVNVISLDSWKQFSFCTSQQYLQVFYKLRLHVTLTRRYWLVINCRGRKLKFRSRKCSLKLWYLLFINKRYVRRVVSVSFRSSISFYVV